MAPFSAWFMENIGLLTEQAVQHLNIALTGLFFGILFWVPAGFFIRHNEEIANTFSNVSGVVLTIPSLALIPALIPLLGIGQTPAIVALVAYSALPIGRSTYLGLQTVDSSVLEVARGLGMSNRGVLLRVQIPLAIPVIMSGIRQAAVLLIAITTVTAYFGAGGLGTSIFAGIRLNNSAQIISAAVTISALAVATNTLLLGAQRYLSGKDVYGSLSRKGVIGG